VAAIVDTNVLARYLTRDPPGQAELARRLIEGEESVLVPLVTLLEVAFVLGHHYGLSRDTIIDLLVALLERVNVDVLELSRDLAVEALDLCRPSNRVSFADALIWASARACALGPLHTFDQRFPSRDLAVEYLG
jgi:predicted nucleic acid-binding protein